MKKINAEAKGAGEQVSALVDGTCLSSLSDTSCKYLEHTHYYPGAKYDTKKARYGLTQHTFEIENYDRCYCGDDAHVSTYDGYTCQKPTVVNGPKPAVTKTTHTTSHHTTNAVHGHTDTWAMIGLDAQDTFYSYQGHNCVQFSGSYLSNP